MTDMKKPSNRKERIGFLRKKKGNDFVSTLIYFTDRELKSYFNRLWENGLRDEIDYVPVFEPPICLRCNKEVEFVPVCGCGERMAVLDPEDIA